MKTFTCLWIITLLAASGGCREKPKSLGADEQHKPSIAAGTMGQGESGDSDWESFLGPDRNGVSTETNLHWAWQDSGLPGLWSRRVGEGYSNATISQGRLYLFDRLGDQARLVCLLAKSGSLLWEFTYPTDYSDLYGFGDGPRTSPLLDGDRVYIFGVEGWLHCLDARTGDLHWKHDTARKFSVVQNFFGVGSTPMVYGDLLIAIVGGSPDEAGARARGRLDLVEPNGSAVVAFDKYSGTVKYQSGQDLAGYASPIVATLQGVPTGLAFCRKSLLAFDPETGNPMWHFPWRATKYESVNASTPVVWNDKILITESYGPGGALLRVVDGVPQVVWSDRNRRDKSMACHWDTPVIVNGNAFGCSGEHSANADLRCIELETGEVKWRQPRLGWSSLTWVDNRLICLTRLGRLLVINPNPERFEQVAEYLPTDEQFRLLPSCWAAPVVSGGMLYIRDAMRLYCFDLRKSD